MRKPWAHYAGVVFLRRTAFLGIMRRKSRAGSQDLQFVSASVYGDGIVIGFPHRGIRHETHPNSGEVAVHLAITLIEHPTARNNLRHEP